MTIATGAVTTDGPAGLVLAETRTVLDARLITHRDY